MVVSYTYQQPVHINERDLNETDSERLASYKQRQQQLEEELFASRKARTDFSPVGLSRMGLYRYPEVVHKDLTIVTNAINNLLIRYDKKQVEALVTKVNLIAGQWQAYLEGFNGTVLINFLHPLRWSKYEPDVKSGVSYRIEVPELEGRIERTLSLLRFKKSEPKTRTVLATVLTQSDLESGSVVYLRNFVSNEIYVVSSSDLPKTQSKRSIQSPQFYETSDRRETEVAGGKQVGDSVGKQKIKSGYKTSDVKFSSPEEIAEYLSRVVRGQDYAIKHVAIATYDHLVRPRGVKKSNVLIIGQTGTGKTELARTVAELLSVPFAEAKLSGKSTTGFKGDNLATVFEDLYSERDNPNVGRSVIFLDEIDKLTERIGESSGFGSQLQNELIGWVESAIVKIPLGLYMEFSVNTENMLFIGAGAFVDLGKPYPSVTREDLIKYGLKPELVGRFPIITHTNPLDREALIDIMKNGGKSNVNQQLRLLREGYGISVQVDPQVYRLLADAAIHQGIGARGIETISNELFKDIKYSAKRGTSLTITPDRAYDSLRNFLPQNYRL
ncbi:AAA family ATPase [Candidatus Woesearchaeota archaeon]|nr:AAA family ATPase [Candidatus Woesearchaeota archaeon]